uniref:suppressor of tumorigenicity 14 protein homolog n=1 Tax=Pristiophorus japonicus TaxID=55135 RepID=UPI00398EAAE5
MADRGGIRMTLVSSSSERADNSTQNQTLLNQIDQRETNSQGKYQCFKDTCNRDACNRTICWKCKMWMLIVLAIAILIALLIIIVICGIRATSIDDDFIHPNLKIYGTSRYYIGSMKISKHSFIPELMMPQSKKYSSLSKDLKIMLCQLYSTSPALGYYFVDSGIFSFSNGSVTAYYWLQFALPKDHDLLIKYTLSAEMLMNVLRQHLSTDRTREKMDIEPSSVTLQVANERYVRSLKTGQCVFRVLLLSKEQTFDSLRLMNCNKNTSNYWLVQGESGRSIKATISTKDEGSVCSGMDVATYNTWFPDSKQTVSKFSQIGPSIMSEIIVSGNMLLVTFNPTGGCNLSQYSITFLQVPMTECGGVLVGTNGSFTSPSYSNDHQEEINCTWNLKVQEHLRPIISFKNFKLSGPPRTGKLCVTDYVEIDGKRFCGEHKTFNYYSHNSSLQIKFYSNKMYTKGFAADYIVTEGDLA